MKSGYIITAFTAAVLLTGCGHVDQPFEKKIVTTTQTTPSFTFTLSAEEEQAAPAGNETSATQPQSEPASAKTSKSRKSAGGREVEATTTKKLVTETFVSTTLTTTTTTTTTPPPTTTTTTTTPPPTTTTPRPTSASNTESSKQTEPTKPTETQPPQTTITYFDPNNSLINTSFDLTGYSVVSYNGVTFSIGDRMSDLEESLGDQVLAPTSITSFLTGRESIEYHYKMLTIVAENDMITSIELERTEISPETEPYLASGIRFGIGIGEVIATFGSEYKLTDPQSLIYSDGATKMIFYAPDEVIERITVRIA